MSKQLSRVEKYGRRRPRQDRREGKKEKGQPEASVDSEKSEELGSRRELHPSQRGKLTRLFYHSLIVLFILLLIGLLYWGRKMMA
ncbi:hypothetical protein [Paenibacillus guangzhouensis]|uniref:hypothetical protein n=1 Tax=Paenibacillus guangzhouensis TaxID=1473112 RepID=UPI001266C191|nr:hypothetical protein [Paenibacillus guangzhouensis]